MLKKKQLTERLGIVCGKTKTEKKTTVSKERERERERQREKDAVFAFNKRH